MTILEINNISHSFDGKKILEDISIYLNKGESVGIIGPSGVGKTTLFNIIAGIIKQDKGSIKTNLKISYMLQKDLLLPFKTVYDNIALPLVIQKKSKEEIHDKIYSKLEDFGLKGLENNYPSSLSGGQKQRAALLRTYMFSEELVLLDEAFSALDYMTKQDMYEWYNKIKEELNLSTLLISHDIEEVVSLCDRIYILMGSPAKISKEIIVSEDREKIKKEIYEVIKRKKF